MIQSHAAVLVALCGIIRGTDVIFRNDLIAKIPVIVLNAWEHIINLIVVVPLLYLNRHSFKKLTLKDVFCLLMIGVGTSALGLICFSQTFKYINPALAVLLQKLQPIITIGLSIVILKERVNKQFFGWAAVAVIFSYFVMFGFMSPFEQGWVSIAKGAAFALGAVFFWGSGTVWGKIVLKKHNQSFVVACRFLIGACFTVTAALICHGNLEYDFIADNKLFINIAYIAIAAGAVATTFFYSGLKWVNASLASILELSFPVSTVIITWLYLHKPISAVQIFAALIVFYAGYKLAPAHS